MTNFTIYGERCTGTNWLSKLIYDNFIICHTEVYGHKHSFGTEPLNEAISQSNDCLFLCTVRNPVDTLLSFFEKAHHQPIERMRSIEVFLTSEFYSITLMKDDFFHNGFKFTKNNQLILGNERRFKNIFEMRAVKNYYLSQVIPKLTPNHYFIRYEQLKSNTVDILNDIQNKFCLKRKNKEFQIESAYVCPRLGNWDNFRLANNRKIKSNYKLSDEIKIIFKNNLDFEVEELCGYQLDFLKY